MRSAITVSLVPQAQGGPFVFWQGLAGACESAAALGFDAIEIFAPSAEAIDRAELRQLLERHSLRVAAFGTGGGWVLHKWHLLHDDLEVRAQARKFIQSIIDLAGEFSAPAIIGSMQGRIEGKLSREHALDLLRESLSDLGEQAAQHGVPLLLEPLNRYETNVFNRLADAVDFVCTLRTSHVKILADLFHMNLEEASIPAALRAAGLHIGHVHFADSNRHAVGLGHIDIRPIVAVLREIGYRGYLSGEILPLPNSHSAAAQTAKAFRDYVESCGSHA